MFGISTPAPDTHEWRRYGQFGRIRTGPRRQDPGDRARRQSPATAAPHPQSRSSSTAVVWSVISTFGDVFGIPSSTPPSITSSGELGRIGLPGGVLTGLPITAVLGDSHAALFAHGTEADGGHRRAGRESTSDGIHLASRLAVPWWDEIALGLISGLIQAREKPTEPRTRPRSGHPAGRRPPSPL